MRRSLALFAALLLPACGVPTDEASPFGTADDPTDDGTELGDNPFDPDAPDDPAAPEDDGGGHDGSDDPEDPVPDPPEDGWDAGAPDVEDGTRVTMILNCGLLAGPATKTWEKHGEYWDEVWTEDPEANRPLDDLGPCFERPAGDQRDKYLQWHEDGFIYIEAGGMAHDNQPTQTEGFWMGEVYPHGESSPECDEALAARGMSWPVSMSLTLVEVVEPAS